MKGKGLGAAVAGSAPTFVTEDSGSDASVLKDVQEEEIRGGLGSGARAGIDGGKQQQATAHQPITSNAAFAASLYQVRRVLTDFFFSFVNWIYLPPQFHFVISGPSGAVLQVLPSRASRLQRRMRRRSMICSETNMTSRRGWGAAD